MATTKEDEIVIAIGAAADLLAAARRLREFSDAAITEAFDLLRESNPNLVDFALHTLGDMDKGHH